jgi:hypothetical protein
VLCLSHPNLYIISYLTRIKLGQGVTIAADVQRLESMSCKFSLCIFVLKNKTKIILKIVNTEEGLFVETTNTMGYTTYACETLKPILERLANYQKQPGGIK